MHPLLASAERIAEQVLLPAALEVDAALRIPESHWSELAAAGLCGVVGPISAGGAEAPAGVFSDVIEVLAGGCLATAFVWLQHQGCIKALAASDNQPLRGSWLAELCSGRKRGGLALGGVRNARLVATPSERGWLLDGQVPWVTGWAQVDVIQVLAVTQPGELISLFVAPTASSSLRATPRSLVAANAGGTVELGFVSHFVPFEHTLSRTPYTPPRADDGGGRSNGSLALGVIRRCCALLGSSGLDAQLAARREQLDSATPETLAQARAEAVELALRASSVLVISSGSRAITMQQHAQRLAREALFLSVFGSRPAIRAALLTRLLP